MEGKSRFMFQEVCQTGSWVSILFTVAEGVTDGGEGGGLLAYLSFFSVAAPRTRLRREAPASTTRKPGSKFLAWDRGAPVYGI